MNEKTVSFGRRAALTGILTPAQNPGPDHPAMILLNPGIVHRVGVNRIYVTIARRLAEQGVTVLRFDLAGIGDSGYADDATSFVAGAIGDTEDAMDLIDSMTDANRIVLAGICSGAVVAFRAALQSECVAGTILINPIGTYHRDERDITPEVLEHVSKRHASRMAFRSSFRAKLLRRKAASPTRFLSSLSRIRFSNLRKALRPTANGSAPLPGAVEDLETLLDRGVAVHVIHGEADMGLDYHFLALGDQFERLSRRSNFDFEVIAGANHVFTRLRSQDRLVESIARRMAVD